MVLILLLRMGEEVIYLPSYGNLDILLASPRCIICDLFIIIINIIFQARERTPPLDRLIYPGMFWVGLKNFGWHINIFLAGHSQCAPVKTEHVAHWNGLGWAKKGRLFVRWKKMGFQEPLKDYHKLCWGLWTRTASELFAYWKMKDYKCHKQSK